MPRRDRRIPARNVSFYDVLEVARDATEKDIRLAYRRLSLLHHPDKNGSTDEAHEVFVAILEAYQILSDDWLRAEYDGRRRRRPGTRHRRSASPEPDYERYAKYQKPGKKNWGEFKKQNVTINNASLALGKLDTLEERFNAMCDEFKKDVPKSEKAVWAELRRDSLDIQAIKKRLTKLLEAVRAVPAKRWSPSTFSQTFINCIDISATRVGSMEEAITRLQDLASQVREAKGVPKKVAKQKFRNLALKWV